MESDTSAEIIMQNTGTQQQKDACKELMLKKRQGRQQAANLVQVCNMMEEATAALPPNSFIPACIMLQIRNGIDPLSTDYDKI